MTQAQQVQNRPSAEAERGPKILRIGIIQGGKIVEERLVRKRETVTIGQSVKNTFVVPASNALARSFPIFEMTPSGYALNFAEGMDGRIAMSSTEAPATLAQLRAKAEKRNDVFHLPLPEESRGKVVIGDVTVLYQFVVPPPVQPRPQLPPSVRGSITQDLDWIMVAIVAISLASHLGFVLYLRSVDWPRKPDIEEIPDRFVQMIVPKKKEEKKEEKKVDPNAEAKRLAEQKAREEARRKAAAEQAKKSNDTSKPRDPEAEARAAAERRAKLAQEVAKMGVLKLLGARGGEGGAGVTDLLRSGDPGGNADKVFESVGGVATAGAGGAGGAGGLGTKGTSGSGTVKGIAGLRASGPGEVSSGEKGGEKVPRGSLKEVKAVEVDGSLSPDLVVQTIKSRKSAVIACYERALKRNPGLSGKVVLRFTISSIGKVTSAEIEDDTMGDGEVNKCITSTVKNWRFPAPQGGEVQFAYPFVFQAS
ncbi:MAG TPA: TonB family protein [Polyangia bacterium]|jgi:TonB family protein|nr:TonB family protein [Polyangia bacterium]